MKYIVETNKGVVRSENQDRADVFEKDGMTLAILCDGMGGHTGGVHASRITIETFKNHFLENFKKGDTTLHGNWFKAGLSMSKKAMEKFAENQITLLDMGTTVTAALIVDNKIYIYNVGDSRTYVYNGLLHQITVDHNVRNYFIEKHKWTPEKASTVKAAAALTSALGPTKTTQLEQFLVELSSDIEKIILTSDGVHDFITKPVFEKIIGSHHSTQKKAKLLIKNAIRGKSTDNLTTIILEVN